MDSTELDTDKDSLLHRFRALSLAADDYATATGDIEKSQIAEKVTELLLEIQRVLARCDRVLIGAAFSPQICEIWCRQIGRTPSNTEQFDLVCDILKTCFDAVNPQSFFRQYSSIVASRLIDSNSSSDLKELLLKQLLTSIERADMDAIKNLNQTDDGKNLLTAVAAQLLDKSTTVSELSTKCMLKLCQKQPIGPSVLFSCQSAVEQLKSILKANEIVRFRMFEFIGAVCIINADCLKTCADLGFVDALLKEVESSDVLCQLNALELLTEMAAPKSGANHCMGYFREKGILAKLNDMLLVAQQSPDATFLFPAVIKFFGHLSRSYPNECCEGYPMFLSSVFDLVVNYHRLDVGQRLLAFDTLGFIGSTPGGKMILANHGDIVKKCLLCFSNSFKQGPVELRVRHIEAFGWLIDLQGPDQTPQLLDLMERWFCWLERDGKPGDSCQLFFDLFRQPFPEVNLAAGQIFKKLAAQLWGRKLMAQQAGLVEYLLNRSTEQSIDGRYMKFEIIKELTDSPNLAEIFDPADVLRFKEYIREGPMYVKAEAPTVALDEA